MAVNVEISVVMSIFNETDDEIKQSVNSILNQSFNQLELLIVIDDPNRDCAFLNEYLLIDKRIRIIRNEKNLGLALSMNKAIEQSNGFFIARMDADDISKSDRLLVQYKTIKSGEYDVVCSLFDCIDEDGHRTPELDGKSRYYNSEEMIKILPFKNIIHHPTTLFTKSVFLKSGGYRNFPCAQDYDLWLRMFEINARFCMVNEVLLDYRIRNNSVSSERLARQKYTVEYIRKLFIERLMHNGKDNFSEQSYKDYLNKYLKNENKAKRRIASGNSIIIKTNQKNALVRGLMRIYLFVTNGSYRHLYFNLFMDKRRIITLLKKGRTHNENNNSMSKVF